MNSIQSYLLFLCLVAATVTGCKKDPKAPPPPTAPIVATAALTNVTSSGATGGGSIVSDGGDTVTSSGIVWSKTNLLPTLADSVVSGTTSTGTFSVNITGLEFDKSYYIRAFATNSVGTGYGDVVTLNTTNDTNKVRFTYNGEEVVYGIIVSPTTGKKWLDRNLGAQQVATTFDDYKAYGDLFQWGRPDDGHQLINWTSSTAGTSVNGMTTSLASSDIPDTDNFIDASSNIDASGNYVLDWRDDNNRNRWATSPQGPCPMGWHVPTQVEWAAEVHNSGNNYGTATTGGIEDYNTAFSMLKLSTAGYRRGHGYGDPAGVVINQNSNGDKLGLYWSSTDKFLTLDGYSVANDFNINKSDVNVSPFELQRKSFGYSVRCVKD